MNALLIRDKTIERVLTSEEAESTDNNDIVAVKMQLVKYYISTKEKGSKYTLVLQTLNAPKLKKYTEAPYSVTSPIPTLLFGLELFGHVLQNEFLI